MSQVATIALEYHDVVPDEQFDTSGFAGPAANSYKLTTANFGQHLDALASQGSPVTQVSADDPASAIMRGGLVLTFDDGGISALQYTAPMLEARGWRGVFFVTTDYIGRPGFLTSAQIAELQSRGHVIGSHSRSHPTRMSACSPAELAREWGDSIAQLSAILGVPITTASVPGGYYSRAVGESAAIAGVRVLFTSEPSTRIARCGGGRGWSCIVIGRYTLRQNDPAAYLRALVGPSATTRRLEWAKWNSKKAVKAVAGRFYLRLREAVFRGS